MIVIRLAQLDEIIALRHIVLRADTTLENAYFPEDRLPTTHHFGAFDAAGRCAGCATFLLVPFNKQPAWQLRGMAVDPMLQKSGLGRRLLTAAEMVLFDASSPRLMWCHARSTACSFYMRCVWTGVGGEYFIIGIPHVTMTKSLDEKPTGADL